MERKKPTITEHYITGVREIQSQYPPAVPFGLINGYTNTDLDSLLGEKEHLLISKDTLIDRDGEPISPEDPGVKMVNMLDPKLKEKVSEGRAQILIVKNQGGIVFS